MNWDLTVLYKDFNDPALAEDLAALPPLCQKLAEVTAAQLSPLKCLEQGITLLSDMTEKFSKAAMYAQLTLSCDASNASAAQTLDKVMALSVPFQSAASAFERYVGQQEELEALISQSPLLQAHGYWLLSAKAQAAHLPDPQVEEWLLKMSLSGGEAFSQLRDKLDAAHTCDFRGEAIPLSACRAKAYDPDPQVRRDAYEAEIASYDKMALPMSYCLNAIKAEAQTMAEAQGFKSVLEMTLFNTRMKEETLNALWTAVKEALPAFQRYLKAKAKLLGHEGGLPFYDLFAPVGRGGRTYTVEEARQTLVCEMSKFTPAMGQFIDHAFTHGWIDMFPREGKSGGAFCESLHPLDESRVLTNFGGSFSDVSTLAHELGHAWHNRCMAGLPILMTDVPMPLAETASIFNETMLTHQVLKSAAEEEAFTLLEAELMEATQTVVDIYSRFLFEKSVVEGRQDHTLSVEELKNLMLKAQEAAYGDGLAADCRHPFMWACKPHYYSTGVHFYNFPYAFGLLFGRGVFAQYLQKGDAFVADYNRLLRACGSGSIEEVAQSVGIDVTSVDFWRSSLNTLVSDIAKFCELCKVRTKN
ncbi:MAG: M3 family oligoendopeptidase [Clostridia bacterium]|nr:M3 family oligoendopeptidase [Clostridia bacterium]